MNKILNGCMSESDNEGGCEWIRKWIDECKNKINHSKTNRVQTKSDDKLIFIDH